MNLPTAHQASDWRPAQGQTPGEGQSPSAAASEPPGADTRRRLLAAAERLFADRGYAGTSVRELTQAAHVNLASVNYHFGGKLNLYIELFRQTLTELRQQRIGRIEAALAEPDATLESLLRAFCEGFVDPLTEDGRGRRLLLLYGREMQEPRLPPKLFFDELIDPMRATMHRALPAVCAGLQPRQVEFALMSLVGQARHVVHMFEHEQRLGCQPFEGLDMATMIEHIVEFSAAGIRHLAQQGTD